MMTFLLYMFYRNNLVFKERMRLLDIVGKRAKRAISNGDTDWLKFYDPLKKVSYEEMVLKFWKPVGSFIKLDRLKDQC